MRLPAAAICFVVTISFVASGDNNGYETIRIPTATNPRCINSKTDQVTLSVYRVIVEKTSGFFVDDKQAGVAVIATLNADSIQLNQPNQISSVTAKTPSVNLVNISGQRKGQAFLPLEYPIASRLLLSQSDTQTKTETKNMLVEMYLEKVRGANTFGTIVQNGGKLLKALPVPANPYLAAANTFLDFANSSIQDDAKATGAKLFATITIQFADRDYPDVQTCKDNGGDSTGAIAVMAATGSSGPNFLTLGNLSRRYCWRFRTDSTYEIQYASKPASGSCSAAISEAQWNEPSNDYVMLLLTATKSPNPSPIIRVAEFSERPADLGLASEWVKDMANSKKLCDSLNVDQTLCGMTSAVFVRR